MDTTAPLYPIEDVLRQSEWITRLARRLVTDRDDADDVAQETIIAAARARPETDRPLRPWLRKVAQNFARRGQRGAGRRRRREEEALAHAPTFPAPDELLERAQMQRQVAALVLGLDEPYRSTVLLRYFDGRSAAAIAREQGVPDGTVRWRLKEALDRLRADLDRRHGGNRRAWAVVLVPGALAGRSTTAAPVVTLKVKVAAMVLAAAGLTTVWIVRHRATGRPARTLASYAWNVGAPSSLRVFGAPLPPPAGTINGTVRDPTGAAVAGAFITAELRVQDPRRWSAGRVVTEADGTFAIADLPDGVYRVAASSPDWVSTGRDGVEVKDGAAVTGIVLTLGRGGFLLSGSVEDTGGGPIASAAVVARTASGAMRGTTDARGAYRLRLAEGTYNLEADADGYARARSSVILAADQTRDFRLDPAARVSGRVVDRATGQPVAGAIVRATLERDEGRPEHTTTDQSGQFAFTELAPGRFTFSASRGARVGFAAEPLMVEAQDAPAVIIKLEPAFTIEGRVTSSGGKAVPRARIFLGAGAFDTGTWNATQMATSDTDGNYVVEGVLPGRYRVHATGDPLLAPSASRLITIRNASASGVSLDLPAGGSVTGLVVSADGRPVAGARVSAGVHEGAPGNIDGAGRGAGGVRTGPDGRFVINGLGAGSLEVWVDHPEHGRRQMEPTALATGERKEVTVRFLAPAVIGGLVRWHDGSPAGGARVRWVPFGRSGRDPVAIAGPDGRFQLKAVSPGQGEVQAELASTTQIMIGGPEAPNKQRLTIEPGQHRDDLALILERATATIRGVVLDPEGRPLAGASVAADRHRDRGWPEHAGQSGRPATTGPDGQFTVDELQRGKYDVFARASGFPVADAAGVDTDGKAVTLRFAAGATVAGVVVGGNGLPVDTYGLLLVPPESPGTTNGRGSGLLIGSRQSVHNSEGRFRWSGLTAGRYDLLVTTANGQAARSAGLELRAGESREDLRLVAGPSTTVRGRIVDADTGNPLAGVGVGIQGTEQHVHARTDEDGVFEIDQQVPGRTLSLQVRPRDDYIAEAREVTIAEGRPVIELRPIRLLPRAHLMPVDQGRGTVGVAVIERDDGAQVERVAPGSPAAAAGVESGDRIRSVRGRNVEGLGPTAIGQLMTGPPGTPVELELVGSGGRQRKVTLVLQRPGR